MGLFYLFILISGLNAFSSEVGLTPEMREVARSSEWKGLLQYQSGILGSERSEVDGKHFFLSPDGSFNPESELLATIQAFLSPVTVDEKGEANDHALCRFPARLELLNSRIQYGRFPGKLVQPRCGGFQTYRERIQNRKVSVVFTSYYSGSASSVFGHSFLKFSGDNENELFDTGVNFSATPTTSNAVLYALYGLIGVFPARFSAQPFYYKVREYNDFESRDLWLYELNLNDDQRSRLIAHLWELGNTHFDYFYFNEN